MDAYSIHDPAEHRQQRRRSAQAGSPLVIYCDASVPIPIITAKTQSDIARSWYCRSARGTCAVGDRTRTEVASFDRDLADAARTMGVTVHPA